MQTVSETRRYRLIMLLKEYGSYAKLNEALAWARTDSQLSLFKNKNLRSNGKPHLMGDAIAREIEEKLQRPIGWMDTPPTYAELAGEEDAISKALVVMERMPTEDRHKAVRLLNALAQPVAALEYKPPQPGTHE